MRPTLLTKAYKLYNRKYFGGRLPNPPEVTVRWEDIEESLMGYQEGTEIAISRKYRYSNSIWRLTLLHEMVHLATPGGHAHGKEFQGRMLKLAKAGAFKKLW